MQYLRESKFISQNLDKWNHIEASVNGNSMDPNDLENSFVELNEDLGYAKTFYPNRSVRVFLNNLLTPIYTKMYKARPWKWSSIKAFFAEEVPLMMAQSMRYLLASFFAVVLGFGIGYYGTFKDKKFAETVLSPQYVKQTEENIKKGDPMAIYKHSPETPMFVSIFTNNLQVGIMVFALGALLCIGAFYVMFINGVMLGVFTYFMISHGVTKEFGLTVFQHGTLEILGMIVEGAAGMVIGGGILFPGTLSRMRSMQNNAQKGVKILIVCLPIILVAAVIESFVTRHTEWPDAIRISTIAISFLLMLGYFVILPLVKYSYVSIKKYGTIVLASIIALILGASVYLYLEFGKSSPDKTHIAWAFGIIMVLVIALFALLKRKKDLLISGSEMYEDPDEQINFSTKAVNSVGNIFLFAFSYLKKNFKYGMVSGLLLSAVGLWILYKLFGDQVFINNIRMEMNISATNVVENGVSGASFSALIGGLGKFVFMCFWLCKFLFNYSSFPFLMLLTGPLLAVLFYILNLKNRYDHHKIKNNFLNSILAAIIPTIFYVGITWLFGEGWWLSLVFVLPFTIAWVVYISFFETNFIVAFGKTFQLIFANFWKFIGCVSLVFILYFILSIGIWFFVIQILSLISGINSGGGLYSDSTINLLIRICYFTSPIMIVLLYFIFSFFAFSGVERSEGRAIMENLKKIGFRKEVYGLETE